MYNMLPSMIMVFIALIAKESELTSINPFSVIFHHFLCNNYIKIYRELSFLIEPFGI
jgi:hypothetical protein